MKAIVIRDSATKTVVECGEGNDAVEALARLRASHGAANVVVDGDEPQPAAEPKPKKKPKRKKK